MMVSSFGMIELLIILFSMGGPFSQLMGLPPGDRDPALACAAVENSVVYVEWAARGEGKPDAPGIDGLAADPEVKEFFARLQAAIEKMIVKETGDETAKMLPEFALALTGHPGCIFLGLDTNAPAADDVPPQIAALNAIRAGLVVNGGDEADAIAAQIKAILKAAMGQDLEKLDHTPLPIPAPVPVQLHRHGDYIILAIGSEMVDQIVGRLTKKSGGLTNHSGFQAAWAELGLKRTGLVAFMDIENGGPQIGKLVGQEPMIEMGLNMAGLTGAKWSMNVTGVVDGQCVSRGMVKGISGDKGLMALVSGRGITTDDFAMIPADSDVVFAVSADIEQVLGEVKTVLGGINPDGVEDIDRGLEEIREIFGLDMMKDVLPAFDQIVTVSNSPGDGGWIGTSPVLTLGIKDQQKAEKVLKAVADLMDREFASHDDKNQRRRRGVVLERRTFMDTDIYMFNTIGDDDVPVAPSWCLTKTHLVIALHPQALKSRLRRMQDTTWKSYGDDFTGGPKGETVVFSAMKMKSVLPQIYGFVPWIGQILFSEMQSDGFDMNLFDFPSAQAMLPYMSDSKSYIVKSPNGLQTHNEGPPILSNLPTLIPSAVPVMFFGISSRKAVRFEAIEAAEPLRR